MFDIAFLRKYPEFGVCEGVQLTLLPPRLRAKPLDEVIRDDEELDTRIKCEKKKIPESPEAVVFAKAYLPAHVWFELPMGNEAIKVQDLVPEDYPNVLQFFTEHFLPVEPLNKAMRLQDDEEGIKECIHQILYYMGCSTSLVAVDDQKRLIGVLIGKIEDVDECTEKTFHKIVFSSKRLQTMYNLIKFILKTVNMHEKYNCRQYYRIYHLIVHRGWLNKGVEKCLITAALKLCSIFKIWRTAGLFTMYKDQYYMKQFGGKTELEVYFSEWRTDRGLRIFRGTGKTEPKIACMSAPVPESFLTSAEEAPPFVPLSSERARRFIQKRLHLWDELDIYRACQCKKKAVVDIKKYKKAKDEENEKPRNNK
uniref:CRISPR system Cascade subunit CasE n=1 Tax=Lygus hesperus TaxID=30085 RepID=A0A0A9W2P3_LYGHE